MSKTKVESPPMTATLDPQDPIPESNWGYRRTFLFLSLFMLMAIKAFEAYQSRTYMWTDFLILTVIVVYTIAPSAEQATKMFQIASVLKAGVNLASSATATAPDGTTLHTGSSATAATPNDPSPPAAPEPPADPEAPPQHSPIAG